MMGADVLDLRKQLKPLYTATSQVAVVEVPAMNFLMVDGSGDPNTSPGFASAIEVLYAVAYTLKFTLKRGPQALDFKVMPLEGLWWADDMAAFADGNRDAWHWTLMIAQPEGVTEALVSKAAADVRRRKPGLAVATLRFAAFEEGRSAQLLHIGPYNAEAANIRRLHDFIAASGAVVSGKHHEIYLSDTRRTAPDKLKTLIRQPFAMKVG